MWTSLLAVLSLVLSLSTPLSAQESPAADDAVFSLTVGGHCPIFALPAANEATARALVDKTVVKLNDLVGIRPAHPSKGLVLYFFQQENGQEGLRVLNSIARRFRDEEVRVLAISIDPIELVDLQEWIAELRLDYPVLLDNYRIVTERYAVRVTPFVVVVDKDGMIYSVGAPSDEELNAVLDAQIRRALE